MDNELQRLLATMRTDLDTFSEVECAALMASGYLAMGYQLHTVGKEVPALLVPTQPLTWWFSPLLAVMPGQEHDRTAHLRLKERLSVGDSAMGRYLKLDATVRWTFWTVVTCLSLAVVVLAAWSWQTTLLTVGNVVLIALVLLLRSLRLDWAALLVDPRRALTVPARHWAGALVLCVFAQVMIKWLDPRYLEDGTLDNLFPRKPDGASGASP